MDNTIDSIFYADLAEASGGRMRFEPVEAPAVETPNDGNYFEESPAGVAEALGKGALNVGRGMIKGVGGLPEDLESLVRALTTGITAAVRGENVIDGLLQGLEQETHSPEIRAWLEENIPQVPGMPEEARAMTDLAGEIAAPVGAVMKGPKAAKSVIEYLSSSKSMDKTSKLPPLVAYHRTTAKPFFEFNPEAERSYHSFAGTDGFYFTESPDDLSTMVFGRNKVKANVHINNPAPVETISSNIGDFSFGRINLTKVPGNMDSVRIIKDGKLELATERNGSKKYSKQELNKLAKQGNLFWMIDPEKISKSDAMIMKQYGYDGFVLRDVPGKPDQVVAIDKSQIDIVSFDDGSGEIINPKLQAESK